MRASFVTRSAVTALAFFVVVLGAAAISVGDLQPSIDSADGNHADRVTVRVDALTDADRDAIRKIFTPRNPNTKVRRLRIGIKPKGPRSATVITSSWYASSTRRRAGPSSRRFASRSGGNVGAILSCPESTIRAWRAARVDPVTALRADRR